MLAEGRSIESIARETGRAASTVAYWVNKHGLTLAARGPRTPRAAGSSASAFEALVEEGLSIRADRAALRRQSHTTVRHWLQRHELKTPAGALSQRRGARHRPDELLRECSRHGLGAVRARRGAGHYRCARCNTEAVQRSPPARQGDPGRGSGRALRAPAGSTVRSARCNSTTAIRRQKPSRSAARESRARSTAALGGARNACYCARTATRWSRPGLLCLPAALLR